MAIEMTPPHSAKARERPPLLDPVPVNHVPANVSINHLQLRNLLTTSDDPRAGRTLYTIHNKSVVSYTLPPSSPWDLDVRDEDLISKGKGKGKGAGLSRSVPSTSLLSSPSLATGSGENGTEASCSEVSRIPFEAVCLALGRVPLSCLPDSARSSHGHGHKKSSPRLTLLAAGGQMKELHLSLYSSSSPSPSHQSPGGASEIDPLETKIWEYNLTIKRASINNSVLILPPSPPDTSPLLRLEARGRAVRDMMRGRGMRVLVSNNDCSVKMYEVDVGRAWENSACHFQANNPSVKREHDRRTSSFVYNAPEEEFIAPLIRPSNGTAYGTGEGHVGEFVRKVMEIRLDSPVNFVSTTPDTTTLLSITDSQNIYIHSLLSSPPLLLRILQLPTIPPSLSPTPRSSSRSLSQMMGEENEDDHPFLLETGAHASFAASWSSDGSKFAVASQSGVLGVWDVRSEKATWVWKTSRVPVEQPRDRTSSGNRERSTPAIRRRTRTDQEAELIETDRDTDDDLIDEVVREMAQRTSTISPPRDRTPPNMNQANQTGGRMNISTIVNNPNPPPVPTTPSSLPGLLSADSSPSPSPSPDRRPATRTGRTRQATVVERAERFLEREMERTVFILPPLPPGAYGTPRNADISILTSTREDAARPGAPAAVSAATATDNQDQNGTVARVDLERQEQWGQHQQRERDRQTGREAGRERAHARTTRHRVNHQINPTHPQGSAPRPRRLVDGAFNTLHIPAHSHSHQSKSAPFYGIRTVKFGHGPSRDLLAFAEHCKRVHVVRIGREEEEHWIGVLPAPLPSPPSTSTYAPRSGAGRDAEARVATDPSVVTSPRQRQRRQSTLHIGGSGLDLVRAQATADSTRDTLSNYLPQSRPSLDPETSEIASTAINANARSQTDRSLVRRRLDELRAQSRMQNRARTGPFSAIVRAAAAAADAEAEIDAAADVESRDRVNTIPPGYELVVEVTDDEDEVADVRLPRIGNGGERESTVVIPSSDVGTENRDAGHGRDMDVEMEDEPEQSADARGNNEPFTAASSRSHSRPANASTSADAGTSLASASVTSAGTASDEAWTAENPLDVLFDRLRAQRRAREQAGHAQSDILDDSELDEIVARLAPSLRAIVRPRQDGSVDITDHTSEDEDADGDDDIVDLDSSSNRTPTPTSAVPMEREDTLVPVRIPGENGEVQRAFAVRVQEQEEGVFRIREITPSSGETRAGATGRTRTPSPLPLATSLAASLASARRGNGNGTGANATPLQVARAAGPGPGELEYVNTLDRPDTNARMREERRRETDRRRERTRNRVQHPSNVIRPRSPTSITSLIYSQPFPSTLTKEENKAEEGDISGLTWSHDGESLFVSTTRGIVEWRITDFGRTIDYEYGECGEKLDDEDEMECDGYGHEAVMEWR